MNNLLNKPKTLLWALIVKLLKKSLVNLIHPSRLGGLNTKTAIKKNWKILQRLKNNNLLPLALIFLFLTSCGNTQPILVYETTKIVGSALSVVQLCPGIPIQYPTSFPEQALCIDNVLYGVMWMGGSAWLSPLPPGDYRSTSPQGCNLVILEGCKIQ